ncbi:MAG: DUF333 domain-containing protein [Nanoarchaeota archaeon]
MKKEYILILIFLILIILTSLLIFNYNNKNKVSNNSQIPNPAAVYCTEQGYNYEIRENPDGSQYGICIFPDGSECEEWAFYSGECEK